MTNGNTDCIYELTIRALYPGTSEYEDSFAGMVEQHFYFKLDSDAKSAIDKNTEKDTAKRLYGPLKMALYPVPLSE